MLTFYVLMFADMIHTVTQGSNGGETCNVNFEENKNDTLEDFCSRDILRSYFRIFGALVGGKFQTSVCFFSFIFSTVYTFIAVDPSLSFRGLETYLYLPCYLL